MPRRADSQAPKRGGRGVRNPEKVGADRIRSRRRPFFIVETIYWLQYVTSTLQGWPSNGHLGWQNVVLTTENSHSEQCAGRAPQGIGI